MPPLQQETTIFLVAWASLPRDCHAVDFLPSYFSCLFSRGSSCVSLFWAYLGTLSRYLLRETKLMELPRKARGNNTNKTRLRKCFSGHLYVTLFPAWNTVKERPKTARNPLLFLF